MHKAASHPMSHTRHDDNQAGNGPRQTDNASLTVTRARGAPPLADGAFHLDLNEAVHLDCVLERELFDDRFDEAGDDHR
jgi:hypothetical protein